MKTFWLLVILLNLSLSSPSEQTHEMVEFPLMVETTPLSPVSAPAGGQTYHFGPHNADITTPATGSFELRMTSGPGFALLDADATDGSATVQLPKGHHDTRLQMQSGQLEV